MIYRWKRFDLWEKYLLNLIAFSFFPLNFNVTRQQWYDFNESKNIMPYNNAFEIIQKCKWVNEKKTLLRSTINRTFFYSLSVPEIDIRKSMTQCNCLFRIIFFLMLSLMIYVFWNETGFCYSLWSLVNICIFV